MANTILIEDQSIEISLFEKEDMNHYLIKE